MVTATLTPQQQEGLLSAVQNMLENQAEEYTEAVAGLDEIRAVWGVDSYDEVAPQARLDHARETVVDGIGDLGSMARAVEHGWILDGFDLETADLDAALAYLAGLTLGDVEA